MISFMFIRLELFHEELGVRETQRADRHTTTVASAMAFLVSHPIP